MTSTQKTKNGAPDGMKQKSLMGWFAKGGPTQGASTNGQPKMKATTKNMPDATGSATETPQKKTRDLKALTSSVASYRSSDVESTSYKDTPPTSDPVDVDMMSMDELEPERVDQDSVSKSGRGKRKNVVEDSDDDENAGKVAYKKRLSTYEPSPEPEKRQDSSKARSKKPRVSAVISDDEEFDESVNSFSKKLSRFKKPAPKASSHRSRPSSDDDFIVSDSVSMLEDSETDFPPTSSRRNSTASSATRDFLDGESASELSDAPKKKAKRPAPKHAHSSSTSVSGANAFLTAAEQRAIGKKSEKKSNEDAFEFLKDVRDKDKNRPGEPGYDPRTLYIPSKAWNNFTPFEKQFWEIKQNHYDTVLFFQKGKFLELYEDDARIGHQEFDLKLTERVKMSMVGVPEMSFSYWAAKFLAKGYKVGRVDQAETALGAEMRLAADKKANKKADSKQSDKIVRRELNKVFTNGTLVDADLLTDEQAGHCVSICESEAKHNAFGVCVLDSATSEFNLSAFEDDACRTKLETLMRQLRPKELLFTKGNFSVSTTRLLKAVLPSSCLWTGLRDVEGFGYDETLEQLKDLYPDDDDAMEEGGAIPEAIRSMIGNNGAIKALGSMIWYLRQLNIDKDILSMKNFNIYDPMKRGLGLVLDGQTLAHIEVLLNSEGTDEGSLLKILSRCITPFGKRLFRIWLCMPLREASAINARLDAVQDLMDHPTFEADFAGLAKGIPDLERIVSRIHAKNCKVKDFLKVLTFFKKLSRGLTQMAETAESFTSRSVSGLLRSAPDLKPNIDNIETMFKKPDSDTDDLVPQRGRDETYDTIMEEINGIEEELDEELKKLEKKLRCSLSYWHSAVGTKEIYMVQTKPNNKDIPKNWIKSGSTKAASRWQVPELSGLIRQLKEARENRNTAVKEFKYRLFGEFDQDRDVWLRTIKVMAELDCLFSLAKSSAAIGEPACRPEFVESDTAFLDFEELRHPALCLKAENFIPNDVKLGGDVGRIALLTGPNMGGKSTVMRMTAVGVIMAQLGMLVPAKKARLAPVDSILTRMGAYDNMFSNASTFKVELDECCKILRDATPKSLVILDELGRGTSTYDGMAIAGSVLHQLATHTHALSFFATHYGSLTDDFSYHPNIRNMHMSTLVDDEKCELVFLYKLIDGIASSSFGTHVANLAGVPMEVVKRAEVVSNDFARQFKERIEGKRTSTLPLVAQADFAYLVGVATGKTSLPESKVLRGEVLKCLQKTVGKYVTQKS
ncbi:DNA mismatch repair protein Msh6 [Rickenella mellea]|uniref:DNA mismatch repair protein n=1 Tax=Rickenella mellea TaxID=50990 RepID=A0A4Y7QE57_9AGAM|nr:DNA mismatch repair protein Msh6 [Rickenella mellea]